MKQRIVQTWVLISAICLIASPAFASVPTPGPEDGVGLAAFAVIGAGYMFLKNRLKRR